MNRLKWLVSWSATFVQANKGLFSTYLCPFNRFTCSPPLISALGSYPTFNSITLFYFVMLHSISHPKGSAIVQMAERLSCGQSQYCIFDWRCFPYQMLKLWSNIGVYGSRKIGSFFVEVVWLKLGWNHETGRWNNGYLSDRMQCLFRLLPVCCLLSRTW